MRLQLDTTAKTIKVEGTVNLNELFEALEKLLPKGLWKKFSIESNTTIVWAEPPVVIRPWYPYYPWWERPVIMYGATAGTVDNKESLISGDIQYSLAQGTYNVEI